MVSLYSQGPGKASAVEGRSRISQRQGSGVSVGEVSGYICSNGYTQNLPRRSVSQGCWQTMRRKDPQSKPRIRRTRKWPGTLLPTLQRLGSLGGLLRSGNFASPGELLASDAALAQAYKRSLQVTTFTLPHLAILSSCETSRATPSGSPS